MQRGGRPSILPHGTEVLERRQVFDVQLIRADEEA